MVSLCSEIVAFTKSPIDTETQRLLVHGTDAEEIARQEPDAADASTEIDAAARAEVDAAVRIEFGTGRQRPERKAGRGGKTGQHTRQRGARTGRAAGTDTDTDAVTRATVGGTDFASDDARRRTGRAATVGLYCGSATRLGRIDPALATDVGMGLHAGAEVVLEAAGKERASPDGVERQGPGLVRPVAGRKAKPAALLVAPRQEAGSVLLGIRARAQEGRRRVRNHRRGLSCRGERHQQEHGE